jgi:hypothetical protein
VNANAAPAPDPVPGFGSGIRVLMSKIDKNYKLKKYFFDQNCNSLIPRPQCIKQQEKPSALKKEHSAFENLWFHHFFLFLQVTFALLDPDPDPPDQNQCRSMEIRIRHINLKRKIITGVTKHDN